MRAAAAMEARAEGGAAGGSPPSLFELSGVVVSSAMGTLEREVWGKGGAGVPGLSHCNGGCFTSVLMQFGAGSSESWAVGGLREGGRVPVYMCVLGAGPNLGDVASVWW